MIGFLAVVLFIAGIVVLVGRRRKRQQNLSGTVASKPVFSVEPPRRRMGDLKGERL